jgi:hypothetical protein
MSRPRSTTTTNPATKETATMTTHQHPAGFDLEDETTAALAAITDYGAPRNLTSFEQEEWTTAAAVLAQWTDRNGSPLIARPFDALVSELLAAQPQPRVKASARVARMLASLVARGIDAGGDRLAWCQIGDDPATDAVLAHVVLPEHSRTARTAETAVVVWYPDGVYTFTDPDTAEIVRLPSMFKGRPAGFARTFRTIDDGDAEFSLLRSALWTLRRLAAKAQPVDVEGDEPEQPTRPPQVCAI